MGVFLEEDGHLPEAEHWYRQAAARIHPQARDRLAGLLKRTGREAEAEAWWRRALARRTPGGGGGSATGAGPVHRPGPDMRTGARGRAPRYPDRPARARLLETKSQMASLKRWRCGGR
ncbi:tetratricopeptide repeat protein [Planomonospora sphaerica]|uniref:tetratricopeptide repeat protein n=1 Tax=Planomonospora sphaerica TaxID=161355 RepID=UPI0012906B1E